jgi:hypothetical protein
LTATNNFIATKFCCVYHYYIKKPLTMEGLLN